MKNRTSITLRGIISLVAVVAVSGAYAQGGYGEGTRIMPHPSPGASASGAAGAKGAANALSAQDRKFINEATQGGLMEVANGKVAAKSATKPDVKNFGQRMVTDHSKANKKLAAIANAHGLDAPKAMAPNKWPGDKEYMAMMVQDHEKDLAEFKTEASKGNDPQLKAFAAETSKVIADHLKMAKQIHGKM